MSTSTVQQVSNMQQQQQRAGRTALLKQRVSMAPVRSFSSASAVRLTSVQLMSEQGREKCRTTRLRCQECDEVVRRGTALILHLSLSTTITSSYTISLAFIPVHGPRERSSTFKATGRGKNISELWLKISLPASFPIGKYDGHVTLSLQSSVEILTRTLHSAVTVLFNPWHHDDDTYMAAQQDGLIDELLVSEVGVMWRGTMATPTPHIWDYGQYSEYCLDAALLLLRDSSADDRRSAAAVSRAIITRLSPPDSSGVLVVTDGNRPYATGTHPCRWNGSAPILQRFYRTRSAVKYAHCWVQVGVAMSMLRALGIPCRAVTLYEVAVLTKQLGQVNRYFTAEGDILLDLQTDQQWPYHIWCEAWMRRDDLPAGYDGWQALSSSGYGPAPVKAILESKHSKLWHYDIVRFLSELHSSVRYHRVTKSYSSYSQRAVTLAHTSHSSTAGLIVTAAAPGGNESEYINITSCYKHQDEEEEERKTAGYSTNTDCSFTVSCEGEQIGSDTTLSITITNHGAMLRTVDGRVVGGVCRHNGDMATKFMGIQFTGAITPGQTAGVSIPVLARQFLRHLVEENVLGFFIVVKVRETRQIYLTVAHHQLTTPPLILLCPHTVRVGETVRVKLSFANPLPSTITHPLFTVQAQQLCLHKELAYRKLVLPGRTISVEVTLQPCCTPGQYTILANMHSDQLTNITGSTKIHVQ